MSKLILTDVDEVLLEWGPAFEKWVVGTERFDVQTDVALRDAYNIEDWLGIPHSTTRELIAEFNLLPDHFTHLTPYADALVYVPQLKQLGYDFVAISACAADDDTQRMRRANLHAHFPDVFDTIHCVGLGASKMRILERYRPTWWVDDKPSHCEDGALLGHKSFMITRSYNTRVNPKGVRRVASWQEIYSCIVDDNCNHPGWYA